MTLPSGAEWSMWALGHPSAYSIDRSIDYGLMFWFTWNRLSGSYFRFTSTSRL